jgi:hypothetical protein
VTPPVDAAGRSGPPDGTGGSDGDGEPTRRFRSGPASPGLDLSQAWRIVVGAARVLVPGTLVASLFFYFGLRYTHDHYRQYGLDDAGLGLSTTDYVVRSLNVTVEPARVVAMVAIAAVALHVALAVALHRSSGDRPEVGERLARRLGAGLVVAGVVGIVLFWSPGRLDTDPVTSAGCWLLSVLAVAYGLYLGWVRTGRTGRTSFTTGALGDNERRVVGALLLAMGGVLVAHGAFELTRMYARERAIQQALRTEASPWSFPLVRIYSDVDMALDDALDVREEVLPGDEVAYRFRYEGLRLYLQQDDRLVLWPADRSPRSGMFVLREADGLRVEYVPELR